MVKDTRVTLRRRHPYRTKSNKIRLVKTPGGKLGVQYHKKLANGAKCGDCGAVVHGVPHLRPKELSRVSKRQKSVTRAYGGSRCATCVRDRIVRAFLIEEQKIVKKVMQQKQKTDAAAKKPAAAEKKAAKKGGKTSKSK